VTQPLRAGARSRQSPQLRRHFIRLKDDTVLFVYTHFTGGAGDEAAAHLASRASSDGGKTWTDKDEIVIKKEGAQNVMSVSLLRLRDGRIALFYLVKNSNTDCRATCGRRRMKRKRGASRRSACQMRATTWSTTRASSR